ncbi:DUF3369 domain-containing protein [Shewanella sp. NIFS-20-20]|uniref:DUF3369 domain-containing protein n=1 Tax=Shewanella sp. NIFS-20-20 TaxID=2853806 RepID=UPI001C44E770|nr:DUF3369 domain-containing protein [Shewanella sp. NIFS-20-20]MBV7315688.1 DUF3369 domain-containing protein [Shewanella sp. NIFS-20-20]
MPFQLAQKTPLFLRRRINQLEDAPVKWKILVVDDEPDVHTVTKLALSRFKLDEKGIDFINAYTSEQAKEILSIHKDIAIAFIDVVMESDHAGLELIRWIRESLGNKQIRLILRTGQPGQAPEEEVIVNYDINDYKAKAELDSRKLTTCVFSALRSYRDILEIDCARRQQQAHRQGLERVISSTSGLYELKSIQKFTDGLLHQLATLLELDSETILLSSNALDAVCSEDHQLTPLAGTGRFRDVSQLTIPKDIEQYLQQALTEKRCIYGEDYFVGYFPTQTGPVNLFYLDSMSSITDDDKRLIDLFALNVGIAFDNLLVNKELEHTQTELILHLGDLIERRDPQASGHVNRVAQSSYLLAKIVGLPESEAILLRQAAPLHDIGKLLIPEAILLKADKLDEAQWQTMQQHAQIGYELLSHSDKPMLKIAALLAQQHHEKYDGSGYPQGISGNNIHIFARILALADVFDSLRHDSCYKKAWQFEDIIKHIRKNSGKHFDPLLVSAFIENIELFTKVNTETSQF